MRDAVKFVSYINDIYLCMYVYVANVHGVLMNIYLNIIVLVQIL